MARIDPSSHRPQVSFRFRIQFSSLPNIQFYGKATNLPSFENNPLTIEYGNTQMKIKGKTKWNDVTMTMYAFENMTNKELWAYMNDLHQDVKEGADEYPDTYKKDIIIQLLGPTNNIIGTWTLVGAFLSMINYGEVDWATEDIIQPQIGIAYDYAYYEE